MNDTENIFPFVEGAFSYSGKVRMDERGDGWDGVDVHFTFCCFLCLGFIGAMGGVELWRTGMERSIDGGWG